MKKLLMMVLGVLFSLSIAQHDASARDVKEIEGDNETFNSAQLIQNGDKVEGVLKSVNSSSDKDFYKIMMKTEGEISFTTTIDPLIDFKPVLQVTIYNSNGDVVFKKDLKEFANGENVAQTKLPAETYYLVIDQLIGQRKDIAYNFELTITTNNVIKNTTDTTEKTTVVPKKSTTSTQSAVVKVASLEVRSTTDKNYKVLGKLKKGTKVTVLSIKNDKWAEITYNKKRGYILKSSLTFTKK